MPKHYRHKNNIKLNLNLPFLQTCVSGSFLNTNIMNWIKLENQLPPKNTLVLVKRYPNKIEEEPIYFAMRQDKELATNPDASIDCYWFGKHKNKFLSEQENFRKLDNFFNFSDVTVKEWCFIDSFLQNCH